MDAIPTKLQLTLVVVVSVDKDSFGAVVIIAHYLMKFVVFLLLSLLQIGLIGFLIVIAMSTLSATKDSEKNAQVDSPGTPQKGWPLSPIEKKSGSVMTPGGRRSARIAKAARKED
jgi:hypothetical protein